MSVLKFLFTRAFLRTVLRIAVAWLLLLLGTWFYLHFFSRHGERLDMPDLRGMTYSQAAEACAGLGLEVVHLDSIYADNGKPFHVLEQVPPPGSGIKSGRNIYLTTYRSLPPAERVGVEEGQDLSVARIILDNNGFKLTEIAEPNVSLVNRVIRLEDAKGRTLRAEDRLKRGSKVTLFYGRTTSQKVAVPGLTGLSLDSARATLRRGLLGLGLVEYSLEIEDAGDSLDAVVIEQHPLPTESAVVPAGTELDLYLGEEGESPRSDLDLD